MNATLRTKRPLPTDNQIEYGRRKVRKGTLSCWECKRRKVRCNYAGLSDLICEGCKRRKTPCVSQEFPDRPAKVDSNGQLYDRLARLETVVHRLVEKIDLTDSTEDVWPHPGSNAENLRAGTHTSSHDHRGSRMNIPTSVADYRQGGDSPNEQRLQAKISLVNSSHVQESDFVGVEYENLSHILVRVWPKPRDLETILRLPDESLGLFHGTMCAPISTILHQRKPTLRENLQTPLVGSHPVLISRKLLILATYLQSLSPNCMQSLDKSSVNYRAIMSSAVERVHGCVTSNDALLESVEGVELIMIESMYQSNAGNLRNAWHLIGRAILIAQMLGLHRGTGSQSLKILDMETRTRVHPEYLWFRLIQMNRYLSLMLGLLQGTPSNSFADYHVLEGCTPTERMQRMDCAAGGYILQRNEAGLYDNATTNMIDQMLQTSAASLPSTWWLVPDLESNAHNESSTLERIIRVMDQLTHYHLISQLHLPNLMRSHTEHEYDYSKTMAVDASREVLIRFISLNGIHSFTSFCRGISFLAFIACTVLCIVHIDAKRQRQHQDYTQREGTLLDLFANQHQRDRGMMELTLNCMQRMARESEDSIASKTANVLRHLLSMEADAALCGEYVATLSKEEGECGLGCGGRVSDCGRTLQVYIPYFGTIKFERGSTSGFVSIGSQPLVDRIPGTSALGMCLPDPLIITTLFSTSRWRDERDRRPQDAFDLGARNQRSGLLVENDWQTVSLACSRSHQRRNMTLTDQGGSLEDDHLRGSGLLNSTRATILNDCEVQTTDAVSCDTS